MARRRGGYADTVANAVQHEPARSARAAGLRYVHDGGAGIRRQRAGRGFRYIGVTGRAVRDVATLDRIRALAIPPAWTDVWICPIANGHVQATGRDARGRKQYRYHPRWRTVRDETKYDRLLAFGEALPALRDRVARDLRKSGLPREKVLAAVVRLLDVTLIRVGNDEYERDNGSIGLTTMHDRHVRFASGTMTFKFPGKSGKWHTVQVDDPKLARVVGRCRDIPGHELFQYVDDDGEHRSIDSGDVNDYLRAIAGDDFTAKDFRTWAGSVCALHELAHAEVGGSQRETTRQIVAALATTAERLGNTPAVCRRSYVHPDVIDAFAEGALTEGLKPASKRGLRTDERLLLALLRRRDRARRAPSRRSA